MAAQVQVVLVDVEGDGVTDVGYELRSIQQDLNALTKAVDDLPSNLDLAAIAETVTGGFKDALVEALADGPDTADGKAPSVAVSLERIANALERIVAGMEAESTPVKLMATTTSPTTVPAAWPPKPKTPRKK